MADCLKADLRIAGDFVKQSLVAYHRSPRCWKQLCEHHPFQILNIPCLIWGPPQQRHPPLPLDDSIYMLSGCVGFVPTSVFKFIRLHPNPEAFHDIRRCTVELLPIAHVTPDQYKHKYKYRYKHKYTNKICIRLQRLWVVHKDLRAQLLLCNGGQIQIQLKIQIQMKI